MSTQNERELDLMKYGSLPIKDKLEILDRDIVSLKMADKEITKSVRKLQGLVKFQILILMFNLIMSGGVIYIIVQNIFNWTN